jgi:hypothetical protein
VLAHAVGGVGRGVLAHADPAQSRAVRSETVATAMNGL